VGDAKQTKSLDSEQLLRTRHPLHVRYDTADKPHFWPCSGRHEAVSDIVTLKNTFPAISAPSPPARSPAQSIVAAIRSVAPVHAPHAPFVGAQSLSPITGTRAK
jgi:hypothetical protein